jgi:hypothetical protein
MTNRPAKLAFLFSKGQREREREREKERSNASDRKSVMIPPENADLAFEFQLFQKTKDLVAAGF